MEGFSNFSFYKNTHLRKALQLRQKGCFEEALEELKLGCEDNDGPSLFLMGNVFWTGGLGVKRDLGPAKKYFAQSVMAGCPWGMLRYSNSKEGEEQKVWYKKMFDSEDALARGLCYYQSLGVESNVDLATEFYLQACKEGNLLAMVDLPSELRVSEEERFFWADKAAQVGCSEALACLGQFFEKGIAKSVAKDETKAFECYFKGALQNSRFCCNRLGRCYERGIGCAQDLPKSAFYYLEAEAFFVIRGRLTSDCENVRIRLKEWFVYGRGWKRDEELHGILEGYEPVITSNTIRIFEESCRAARKAALCFVHICKQSNWLSRDLRRLIGEMVWQSREDPMLWNIELE